MYLTLIDYFEKWHKGKIEDLLLLSNVKVVEETLIQYIISLHDRHLAYATIKQRLAAIVSFLELNDVTINHKLKKFIGEHNKTVKDQAYTREDLLKMFQHSTFRTKLVIAIYSSTGIRKSAIIDLKLKHLEKIDSSVGGLYKFTIYENTNDEYITFCTPECVSMIDTYLDQRKAAGEIPYMTLDPGKAQTIYTIPFSKKVVDDIISKSAHSDKDTIIYTIKFVSEDFPYIQRAPSRCQFSYDQFTNWKFEEACKHTTQPQVDAWVNYYEKKRSGNNLAFELT